MNIGTVIRVGCSNKLERHLSITSVDGWLGIGLVVIITESNSGETDILLILVIYYYCQNYYTIDPYRSEGK